MKFSCTLISISLLFIFSSCNYVKKYNKITGYAQGGTYQITYSNLNKNGKVIRVDSNSLKEIVDNAFSEIDFSLSGYNKASVLNRINRNGDPTVDSIFIDIFKLSKLYFHETDGVFDITSAPLFEAWGFGFGEKITVTQSVIDSIMTFTGMDKIDISGNEVIKCDPRVSLNFNAIAQGYACDYVANELERLGFCDFLIEMGGEIYCKGLSPRGDKWRVAIDAPVDGNMSSGENIYDVIEISDCGVVTSGNYRKFYVENGEKFSHTIDPRTGYPVKHNLLSATVIAENATMADVYATYLMVIGVDEAIRFLESRDDIEGYLIYGDQEIMNTYFTSGLNN